MTPEKQFVNSEPSLDNASAGFGLNGPSFRDAIPSTSAGIQPSLPMLPPRPDMSMQPSYGMNNGYSNYMGMGGSYGLGGGLGMGGYGNYGNYGYGGYGGGGYGFNGMSPYGGFNRYGDIESRFIQVAEESSRPAFDSIQSVVHAVGSVAMMLENTFIALTSSFRAILGVAENFGRLRSLFAQFWSTFAVIRSINWLVRKLLVMMGIRTEDEFKAWAQAVAATQAAPGTAEQPKRSTWPILMFFGVITAAPYIVLRMLNGLSSTIHEKLNEPATWQEPLRAIGQHNFQGSSPQELSFSANQIIYLAPQRLQANLWNSGWLMGTTDRKTTGLVPVNYIKVIKPTTEQANKVTNEPKIEEMNEIFKESL